MSEGFGLEDFVAEIRAVVAKKLPAKEALAALAPGFRRLLSNRTFLQEKLAAIGSHADEVCLYRDPEYDFTVLARGVSGRRQQQGKSHAGVPHDHGPLWALYGLYEGTARMQRWEPDATVQSGPFPGLRLIADVPAKAGEFDAIEPHNMHLPVFPPEGGSVILVVYNKYLESVQRRGYVAAAKGVVTFQGTFPPTAIPAEPVAAR
jgi:hypothetical protein